MLSEPKLISPLLDGFAVGSAMSEHHGVRCYPAMRNDSDQKYIVKIISVPASQVQLQALLLTGAYKNAEDATRYFSQVAQGLKDEADILTRLSKLEGFLPYEGCQVVAKDDEPGFDVYLLGTYKQSLERHFRKNTMTQIAAVNLGLDMCASLAVCRQAGYVYTDLKPSNIFISEDNEYRIGDLGFLSSTSLKYATLPDRCRSAYNAPELSDPFAQMDPSVDVYSAGLILYQVYNGGVLPFQEQAPAEPLPAPMYADYEMAEIILKACSPDPKDRWANPIKMGQALVSYMQRNGANDIPIVPPAAELDIPETDAAEEEVPFEEEPTGDETGLVFDEADAGGQLILDEMMDYDSAMTPPAEQAQDIPVEELPADADPEPPTEVIEDLEEDDPANLSFLDELSSDETAPQEEMADDIRYGELSEDAAGILSLADDLIAHETPAPAVAPEPIDVPMPEPIVLSESEQPQAGENTIEETVEFSAPVSEAAESDVADGLTQEIPAEAIVQDETAEKQETDEDLAYPPEDEKPDIGRKILITVLIVILSACLLVTAYLFYRDYYIKTVDKMELLGVDNTLTVYVTTDAEPGSVTVICTDTYGNKQTCPLEKGVASFAELSPDTHYTITLDVAGFHGLKGDTKKTYTTEPKTEVMTFVATTGSDSGTVILSFTIKETGPKEWKVTYRTDGEQEKTAEFTGHMTTVTGLTKGKTYTFTLDAKDQGYVVGKNTISYTAVEPVLAQNLEILSNTADGMLVEWEAPEGSDVAQWTVICYNDSGYTQNLTTSETNAKFTGTDPAGSYTVEVTAAGMSRSVPYYLSKNAVTATNYVAEYTNGSMNVSWEFTGPAPAGKWLVTYTVDSDPTEYVVNAEGTTAIIPAIVPNSTYTLLLKLEDGTSVIAGRKVVAVPEGPAFAGFTINKSSMRFLMCLAPDVENWTRSNVTTYKDTFAVGEKAGFVARMLTTYGRSNDPVHTVFAIRDSSGKLLTHDSITQSWSSMWYINYCELTIPNMPKEPGEYTITVYFNGGIAHTQTFKISE